VTVDTHLSDVQRGYSFVHLRSNDIFDDTFHGSGVVQLDLCEIVDVHLVIPEHDQQKCPSMMKG
jgi:hypothetical protein